MRKSNLVVKLEKLEVERKRLIEGYPFLDVVVALARENGIGENDLCPHRDRDGNYYDTYVRVVLLYDSGSARRDETWVVAVDSERSTVITTANAALIVDRCGEVLGAVTRDREFATVQRVGIGQDDDSSIRVYRRGTRVPRSFKKFLIWFSDAAVWPDELDEEACEICVCDCAPGAGDTLTQVWPPED